MTTTPTPHDGEEPDRRDTPRDHDVATTETPSIERAAIAASLAPVAMERLLKEAVIPSTGAGPDRRRAAADVLRYRSASLSDRRAAVAEMVALSQELGLE